MGKLKRVAQPEILRVCFRQVREQKGPLRQSLISSTLPFGQKADGLHSLLILLLPCSLPTALPLFLYTIIRTLPPSATTFSPLDLL